jgi:dihydroxyacid dehydratase/phosphogluconate dehydratase
MGSPEGEKGLFTGAVHTGDTIQIDLNRVLG